MEVQIAVSKTKKYAASSSGDTVEIVERPQGGLSVVLADGQSSGKGAKSISNMVVRKVISLLAEGVRDGAAARAASDTLFTEKGGKVSSTLNILSVDLLTRTLVITRNNPLPAVLAIDDRVKLLTDESHPIGIYRDTRPIINEIPLNSGLTAIVFSDGLVHAGSRIGEEIDMLGYVGAMLDNEEPTSQLIADSLLSCAIQLDDGRPSDDISIVVLRVFPHDGSEIRRMSVWLPIPDITQ
jgi:serine phosphatase RsbU (regulator of sigma subunit)